MKKGFTIILLLLISLSTNAQTGNALYFDGTNDYVDFGTFSAVDYSHGFTFNCLVKWNSSQANKISPIMTFSSDIILMTNSIGIYKNASNKINTDIIIENTKYSKTWNADIPTNEWIFLSLTIDSEGSAKLYINGELEETADLAVPVTVSRACCYLGRRAMLVLNHYFNGFMDEVSLWNRQLTQSEIISGMNNGFSSDADSLLSYFKFNQGTSGGTNTEITTLHNEVASGSLTGTLKNFALNGSASNWISVLKGSGTTADPYQIATMDDLSWLSINGPLWNKKYVQTSDINASPTSSWNSGRGFMPIGNKNKAFTGSYNGKGHEITGLTISRPSTDFIGLFGNISGADLDSIGISMGKVTGYTFSGGLIGNAENYSTINYCHFNGDVSGYAQVGGFMGENSYSTVTDSYSTGSAVCEYAGVGGFVGSIDEGKVKYCFSTADATSKTVVAGGFAGSVSYGSTVEYCYSRGNSSVVGSNCGGFTGGSSQYSSAINHCYSTGTSSGLQDIGGFIGFINSSVKVIKNCFFNTETSNRMNAYGRNLGSCDITGVNSATMRLQKTFLAKGWDFAGEKANGTVDKMVMSPDVNDGFPCFIWQGKLASPVITTDKVSDITADSAVVAGSVTSLGFPDPYAYGICWNTSGNPTVKDSRTNHGIALATGSFADTLSKLDDGKTYYFRAYAINSADTAYGQILSFTTKAYADITWGNPSDIVYGTALSNTQLNAVANTDGTFVYTPSAGTVLSAGKNQQLLTTFTPTNQDIYVETTKAVFINVNKVTPVITWSTPTDIAYGTALGDAQLNASSDMEGLFSYNQVAGTVLQAGNNQILVATFTPSDTLNYAIVKDTVYINILHAPLIIINSKVITKPYDGTDNAAITGAELSGVIGNDVVTLTNYSSGSFAQSAVGENIPVTTNMSIEGDDASNYIWSELNSLTGNIVARTVTVSGSFSASDKAYDGNTSASIIENNLSLVNTIDNDDVTLVPVVEFASPDVADDIQVILTADSYLKGEDSGNYILLLEGAPTSTSSIIQYYTITALAGSNGSIDPSGSLTVRKGSSQTYTIIPVDGYNISGLLVDGTIVDAVNEYTFNDISKDHQIEATFSIKTDVLDLNNSEISVYPNPTSDDLHIVNASGYRIRMVNLQGTTLINKNIESNKETISLSSFPSGTYFLVLKGSIVKVIKK